MSEPPDIVQVFVERTFDKGSVDPKTHGKERRERGSRVGGGRFAAVNVAAALEEDMSAVAEVRRPVGFAAGPLGRANRVPRVLHDAERQGSGNVISIADARRRLRGDVGLEASVSRHPAGKGAAVDPRRPSAGDSCRHVVATSAAVSHSPRAGLGAAARTRPFATLMIRLAAWVTVVIIVFGAALGLGLLLQPEAYSGPTWTHSVTAGESVWGLASSVGSSRPLEDVVADIVALNQLDGQVLHPGQEVLVPVQ